MADPLKNTESDPLVAARNDPRVLYAAERTFLAWVRTGLALMGFGFVVARFGLFLRELLQMRGGEPPDPPPTRPGLSLWVGTTFVLLGVVVHLAAAWRHREVLKRLQPPVGADRRWSGAAALLGLALAGAGILLAAYLVYTR